MEKKLHILHLLLGLCPIMFRHPEHHHHHRHPSHRQEEHQQYHHQLQHQGIFSTKVITGNKSKHKSRQYTTTTTTTTTTEFLVLPLLMRNTTLSCHLGGSLALHKSILVRQHMNPPFLLGQFRLSKPILPMTLFPYKLIQGLMRPPPQQPKLLSSPLRQFITGPLCSSITYLLNLLPPTQLLHLLLLAAAPPRSTATTTTTLCRRWWPILPHRLLFLLLHFLMELH